MWKSPWAYLWPKRVTELKSKKITLLSLLIFAPFVMGVSGCPNLYSELAKNDTDEARLYEAKQLINGGEYARAVETLQLASAAFKDNRPARVVLGSAYAGLCGLDLISLTTELTNLGTTKLFVSLLSTFRNSTALAGQANACLAAEQLILGIAATEKTSNDHVFLAFIALAKIGTNLGQSAANNAGSVAPGFDACSAAHISDSSVRQIGTGLTIMLSSFTASGSIVLSGLTSIVGPICTAVDSFTGSPGFCQTSVPSDFTTNEVLALRALIKSNEIGLNTCGGSLGTGTCFCL